MSLAEFLIILPFFVSIPLGCVWIYKGVFKNDLMFDLAQVPHPPVAAVNHSIASANKRLGSNLHFLDMDNHDGDTYKTHSVGAVAGFSDSRHKIINSIVGGLFSVGCCVSIHLTLALMIQLTDVVDLSLSFFQTSIGILVLLAALFQPLLIISLFVNQDLLPSSSSKAVFHWIATCSLYIAWLYLLKRFGSLASELDAGYAHEKTFLQIKTNEIVLAGVSSTAVLSGIACALTPFRLFYLDWYRARNQILSYTSSDKLNRVIASYNSTWRLLQKRRADLDSLLSANGGSIYNEKYLVPSSVRLVKGSGRKLMNKVQSFANLSNLPGIGGSSEQDELLAEIDALESLSKLLLADVQTALGQYLQQQAKTPMASILRQVEQWFYVFFSIYCVYRMVNVVFIRLPYHYWFKSEELHDTTTPIDTKEVSSESVNKNTKDALAITLAKVIQSTFGYLPISETQLINQICFILSGSLFVCSFQNVLTTIQSFRRLLPASTTAVSALVKNWLRHLIVSEFLAIYVVATALMIRSNLPPEVSLDLQRILSLTNSPRGSSLETEFIDTWFDKVFGLTCVVTLVVVVAKSLVEDTTEYDEEAMMEDTKLM